VGKKIITYNDYDHLLDKLIDKIDGHSIHGELKYVYGPPRGGLPIAVHLSHHLGLEFVTKRDICEWLNMDELQKVLLVDDIADTGKTLHEIKDEEGIDFITATLYYKPRSIIKPDFFVEETTEWCCFPWERLDEEPNREGY